jgi:hypothetical protein
MSTLAGVLHEKHTSQELGSLIEALAGDTVCFILSKGSTDLILNQNGFNEYERAIIRDAKVSLPVF